MVKTYQGEGGIFEVDWNSTGDKLAACVANGTVSIELCDYLYFFMTLCRARFLTSFTYFGLTIAGSCPYQAVNNRKKKKEVTIVAPTFQYRYSLGRTMFMFIDRRPCIF